MTAHVEILRALARRTDSKIVLLVLDGVGDIHTGDSPRTPLESATTPNLDKLAEASALGLSLPVDVGITPGSGPGHLGLFGYDPTEERHQIGRGVLEALGINYSLEPGQVAARGNYCTLDAKGRITDRRAGRPSQEDCERVSALLDAAIDVIDGVGVRVLPVKEHRFCAIFSGPDISAAIEDTDPQQTGVAPLTAIARDATPHGARMARVVDRFVAEARAKLSAEPKINGLTLRGFSTDPGLPTFGELYRLAPAAVAAYPLYRGVARLAGMDVLKTGPTPADAFATVARHWADHDFFFIHIKKTDSSGEDGDREAKIAAIESVDAAFAALIELKPDVIAVTGDHGTPHVMKSHSWHAVPLLVHGPHCDIDQTTRFTESEARQGSLGTLRADRLIGLLLANGGKLAKFGA
jgi:2,3-bisphosphoglycerate-independent phosphoglycerate mutase